MDLLTCVHCPPDDNEWPANCFTFRGSAFWHICNACWAEHYVRIYKPCTVCGVPASVWRLKKHADLPFTHRGCRHEPVHRPRTTDPELLVLELA